MLSVVPEFAEDYNKIEQYCAFQEHCEFDVQKKLKERKIPQEIIDLFIKKLKIESFLDNKRYCQAFVTDHVNIKRWGKQKIYSALKAKFLPDDDIKNAIQAISKEKYLENLNYLFEKKKRELYVEKDELKKKAKIIRYLASNGYETNLIFSLFD